MALMYDHQSFETYMKTQSEPIVIVEDVMILIQLENASFEVNEEVMPVIDKIISAYGFSSIQDLEKIKQEDFFSLFSPLLNSHFELE